MRDRSNFLIRVAYICQEHELTRKEARQVVTDLDVVYARKWVNRRDSSKHYDAIIDHVYNKKEDK